MNDLASIIKNTNENRSAKNLGQLATIDSERDVFNDVRDQLFKVQSGTSLMDGVVENGEEFIADLDDMNQDVVSLDIEDNMRKETDETKEKETEIEMNKKNKEIERLRNENKILVETHIEIQKTLKSQLAKRDKEITEKKARINNLREQKRTLEMKIAKKSCNLVPWCK